MKKNVIKIITMILIIFLLINYIPTISNATSIVDNVFKDGKDFLSTTEDSNITEKVDGSKIIETSKSIYNILLTIGIIVATIIILVLGIQFMTGSIEQKAKVKEMLIPFIVGCIVVFGSLGIWKLVVNLANDIFPSSQSTIHSTSSGSTAGGGGRPSTNR